MSAEAKTPFSFLVLFKFFYSLGFLSDNRYGRHWELFSVGESQNRNSFYYAVERNEIPPHEGNDPVQRLMLSDGLFCRIEKMITKSSKNVNRNQDLWRSCDVMQ